MSAGKWERNAVKINHQGRTREKGVDALVGSGSSFFWPHFSVQKEAVKMKRGNVNHLRGPGAESGEKFWINTWTEVNAGAVMALGVWFKAKMPPPPHGHLHWLSNLLRSVRPPSQSQRRMQFKHVAAARSTVRSDHPVSNGPRRLTGLPFSNLLHPKHSDSRSWLFYKLNSDPALTYVDQFSRELDIFKNLLHLKWLRRINKLVLY